MTRPGLLLAVLLAGQFMALLDTSVVNIAVPTIRDDLSVSAAGLQLIVAAYTIAYAVLLITGARIGARRGHRRTFLDGMALFTAASAACGLAASANQLIAFRIVQGAGAALMVPQVLSIIQRAFEGPARTRALGLYATAIGAGSVIGLAAGGMLVSADLFGTGWRPVFLLNVPIGLAVLGAARWVPVDPGDRTRTLDLPGLAVAVPGITLFIVPLVLGREQHWPLWTLGCLVLSVPAAVAFVLVERRVQRRGGAPLVPGRILRHRAVVAALVTLIGTFTGYGGWLLCIALYVQSGLGHSPLTAGLMFMAGSAGFSVMSLTWRRLPVRWHRPLIPVGLLVAVLAMALLLVVVVTAGPGGPHPVVLAAVLPAFGCGLAAAFSPSLAAGLADVPVADASNASGLLTTVVQLAQALGVAVFGGLYLSLAAHRPPATAFAITLAGLIAVNLCTAVAAALLFPRPQPAPPSARAVL